MKAYTAGIALYGGHRVSTPTEGSAVQRNGESTTVMNAINVLVPEEQQLGYIQRNNEVFTM